MTILDYNPHESDTDPWAIYKIDSGIFGLVTAFTARFKTAGDAVQADPCALMTVRAVWQFFSERREERDAEVH